MPAHQRHQEPPESQDVDAVGTQAVRELQNGSQPQAYLTADETRIIKGKLRVLLKSAEATNANAANAAPETVGTQVKATEKVYTHLLFAQNASLAVIDSKVIGTHADTAAKLGKRAREEANAFEEADFYEPLRELLGLDSHLIEDLDLSDDDGPSVPAVRRGGRLGDWAKIGWIAMKRSRRAPGSEFMNGMMAVEHTRRVVNRRARQKQVLGPEVRPQEVRQEDMTKAANPTIKNTEALNKLLYKLNREINYFEWVINPRSYGQSLENVFYTSFLVANGLAAIAMRSDANGNPDGSGIPVIYSTEPPTEDDRRAIYDEQGNEITPAMTKRQVIMEWNMQVWKDAIELFDIRESIIPHREEAQPAEPGASGWYA